MDRDRPGRLADGFRRDLTGTEVRVPYRLLTRDVGTPRKQVQSRTDSLRAPWQAGARVAFAVGPAVLHGTISRVNPRYAHVVCDDDREYRVPYARLEDVSQVLIPDHRACPNS